MIQVAFGDGSVRGIKTGITGNPDFATWVHVTGWHECAAADLTSIRW